MSADLAATRDFTCASDVHYRAVTSGDGRVVLSQLVDLFEGVTNEMIMSGLDEASTSVALNKIRHLSERSADLESWVDSVLERYRPVDTVPA